MIHRLWTVSMVCLLLTAASTATAGAPSPALELKLDEGTGTTALNSGTLGVGSNGAISGPVYSNDSARSSGFSLFFDGDTDFVEIADTFDYGNQGTVEAWIKPTAVDGQRAIYDDYGNPGVFMAISSGQFQWNISTPMHPGLGIGIFAGTICPDMWQHVAGTYDGAMLRAYVSGVEVGSAATTGIILDNSTNATHIGADSATPNALEFAGHMDDIRLFPVALAPEEMGDGSLLLVCGELTGDCNITATDALAGLRMAVGLLEDDFAADVNGSETITATDSLAILRMAVGTDIQTNACNLL